MFPANNPWNQRVDKLPVASNSDAMVRAIGADDPCTPDFGSGSTNGGPIGIPYTTVVARHRRVRVTLRVRRRVRPRPVPDPAEAPIEGGASRRRPPRARRGPRRAAASTSCSPPTRDGGASWHAGSGAIFDLRSNKLRPAGWTRADAAGLPILPGLARYDEVKRGEIDHALRFTVARTRNAYVYPARHYASSI